METQYAYCSACDRYVRVTWTPLPLHDGQANIPDPEVICLEYGHNCTGSMCPLFKIPTEVLRERFERSGLKPDA